jgi:tight adherence protein C
MDAVLEIWSDPTVQFFTVIAMAGLTVFLFALGVTTLVSVATDPVRRRLGALAPADEGGETSSAFTDWVQRRAKYLLPGKGEERDKVQRQLAYAGFRSPNALPAFYGIKTILGLGLLLAVLTASRWLAQYSLGQILFFSLMSAGLGLVLPNIVLRHLVERRQKLLRNGFPDALDMLVICVEAGLGLTAAIQRVADELKVSHPELGAELALVNAETRAGVEREAALRNLTERTGLDDIRGLVSLLIQTLKFGTSIADTLRVYSEEFRDKRMQRAEEIAAKVGTKLIFPLVFCLFPSFFIVAIGPAVIRIISVFQQLGDNVAK